MLAHAPTSPGAQPRHIPVDASLEHNLQWLQARRVYAFDTGEAFALRRVISADAYLFLYKELVRLCKHRTYCWAGVEWLAQRLQSSPGTIKRWLTQLVGAGLIRRTPRPGGDTALTTIVALVTYDDGQQQEQSGTVGSDDFSLPASKSGVVSPLESSADTLFFAPEQQITSKPSAGSALSRHTVKKHDLNVGMVGNGLPKRQGSDIGNTPVTRHLIEAGVTNGAVLQELNTKPVAEIAAICRYVAAQPNSYNPAGLVVALARQGFGTLLLRPHRVRRPQPKWPAYGSADQARQDEQSSAQDGRLRDKYVPSNEHVQLWADVQATLAQRMPLSEFDTWIRETYLAALTDDQAFIGTPNVFARDKLSMDYLNAIADALQVVTGNPYAVEVVIGKERDAYA